MRQQYSFYDNSNDEDYQERPQKRTIFRRNLHVPQSRETAKSGTIGSFSSITSRYNNIYGNDF
jgi:hypothetical protein